MLRKVATRVRRPPSATAELVWPILSRVPVSTGFASRPSARSSLEKGISHDARRPPAARRPTTKSGIL